MRILILAALAASAATAQAQPTPNACGASKVKAMLGKKADAATIAAVRKKSGAKAMRVIKPGQMVTMDYSETRLNVSLDAKGRIKEFGCG
jgi:hypothetical protein